MDRARFVWAACFACALSAPSHVRCESAVKQESEELVVLYITAIEELDDEARTRQVLSEPTLVTKIGRPSKFLIGGQVLHGDEYIDIGHQIEFLPTKVSGKDAIWIELQTQTTDYVIDKKGKGYPAISKERLTGKYQIGKKNVTKSWKSTATPGRDIYLEFRVELMTNEEYEQKSAEAFAAAKAAQKLK